jgi:hypothetical protein
MEMSIQMWIQTIVVQAIGLAMAMIPVIASLLYFRSCRERHAHMMLYGSVVLAIAPVVSEAIKCYRVINSPMELTVLQSVLPSLAIGAMSALAYLCFACGFFVLIKKVTGSTTRS